MIDIHTHLHPAKLAKAIQHWFWENARLRMTHPTEPQAVAENMRKHGMERFVFCSYAHKKEMARSLNQWLAETSRSLDRYGLPLATVFPDDAACAQYYEEALKNGCVGLKIHEDVQRFAISDPRLDPIHKLTEDHDGFILVHVGPIPWQTDTNDGPGRIAQVLRKFPKLKIVVAHFGLPDSSRYLEMMADYPNLYLDTTMAITPDFPMHADFSRELFSRYSDRILFGSDYPIISVPYDGELKVIQGLGLEPEELKRILGDNARKILGSHLYATCPGG